MTSSKGDSGCGDCRNCGDVSWGGGGGHMTDTNKDVLLINVVVVFGIFKCRWRFF